ncbi:MAG: ABC transporter permease [Lachnospiraceae bacterium]|nr:ABC transporter permease [Lachnospiraceae bacterium]
MVGIIKEIYNYRDLIKELISKNLKLKYRRSVLGYLWSLLNPLGIMLVMVIVFSNIFRFDIEYYPVYLIIGQTMFNYMSVATSHSMYSVIENGPLIKKIFVPKYIFTFSKVTSDLVDYLLSMSAIVLVMIITKVPFSWNLLWVPIVSLELYIFCIGLGLLLAQASVFFRDIQYIYSVIITAWTYLTPIFYPDKILPEWLHFWVVRFNPMFMYIKSMRQCVIEQTHPDFKLMLVGLLFDILAIGIGGLLFKKNQSKFILYI